MRARGKSRERLAAPCAFTHAEKPSGPNALTADFRSIDVPRERAETCRASAPIHIGCRASHAFGREAYNVRQSGSP